LIYGFLGVFDMNKWAGGHRIIEGFGDGFLHAVGVNDDGRIIMFFRCLPREPDCENDITTEANTAGKQTSPATLMAG